MRRLIVSRSGLRAATANGMTLVELMVGLVIGLFIVAVMGSVYVGSRTTYAAQESTGRVQENGRFAMDTITQDLRMSGFRGCLGQTAVTNTLNTDRLGQMFYDSFCMQRKDGSIETAPAYLFYSDQSVKMEALPRSEEHTSELQSH